MWHSPFCVVPSLINQKPEGLPRKVVKGSSMTPLPNLVLKKPVIILTLIFTMFTVLLVACGKSDPATIKPEITLSVNKTSLPDGGDDVELTVKVVNKGKVDSVTFRADTGLEIAPVTSPNEKGDFVAVVRVTTTTKFTAEATGPAGTGRGPAEGTTVQVAPPDPKNDAVAPSTTSPVKGFVNMSLTTGAPSGLSVIVSDIPGVTGKIVGEVQAKTITTAKGTVTIQAGTDKLEFIYKPKPGTTADSFEYTVIKTGRPAIGKIDVALQSVPGDIEVIDGNDDAGDINGSSKSKILLTKDVDCTEDRCIRLDSGQTLAGSMVINDLTVTNSVKPKIKASIPNTRKSGTASCTVIDNPDPIPTGGYDPRPNCDETRVIVLNDNTTVEGIEITSESTDEASTYFIAIFAFGDSSSGENVLDGNIKIKNVTINRSNGKPIYIKYTFPNKNNPNPVAPKYGDYNLVIDGLDLNDANDTLVIGNPKKLVFTNSTIDLMQPKGNNAGPQPFGDNSGVQIVSYNTGGDITLDNLDVFMESPKYQIDFGFVSDNCTPIEIYNDSFFTNPNPIATTVTVKNSDITFGTSSLTDVYALKVISRGGTIDIGSGSTNNKSVRGVQQQGENGGVVNGSITIKP
jgi:hypothetical protein